MSDSRVKTVATPVGDVRIAADATGLLLCDFADGRHVGRSIARLPATTTDAAMLDRVRDELARYFAGDLRSFTVPLPPTGTAFQQAAWQQLLAIPFGETRSYGRQAADVGRSTAVRAVARANGSNARCIVVPCHRVIGASGTLTGFGGGLGRKRWLLDHEQRVVSSVLASGGAGR